MLDFDLETIRISTGVVRSILKVVLKLKIALIGKSYDQITVGSPWGPDWGWFGMVWGSFLALLSPGEHATWPAALFPGRF